MLCMSIDWAARPFVCRAVPSIAPAGEKVARIDCVNVVRVTWATLRASAIIFEDAAAVGLCKIGFFIACK